MNLLRRLSLGAALAAALLVASPALALDPHYAGTTTVKNVSTTSTAAAQVLTVATLSPGTVNSGTNSFVIRAVVNFNVPLGHSVHIQLSKTVSATTTVFADTLQEIRGDGFVVLETEVENVAASTTLNVQCVMDVAGLPVSFGRTTLTAVGLAGNTQ